MKRILSTGVIFILTCVGMSACAMPIGVRTLMWGRGAVRGAAVKTYTVTYAPGAYGTGTQQTVTKTHNVTLPLLGATFVRAGFSQTGWATSDGGTQAYALGGSYTADASVTLYPVWTANTYTIRFDLNGGGTWADETVAWGAWKSIAAPTRAGYTFVGWRATGHNTGIAMCSVTSGVAVRMDGSPFDAPMAANGRVSFCNLNTGAGGDNCTTLTARWAANTYTIRFDLNGGGTRADETVAYGAWKSIAAPTRAGYTFAGWRATGHNTGIAMCSVKSGVAVNMDKSPFNAPMAADGRVSFCNLNTGAGGDSCTTLTAQWVANTYTIRYDLNGGGTRANETVTYGAWRSIAAPTRAGYTFVGWRATGHNAGIAMCSVASGVAVRMDGSPFDAPIAANGRVSFCNLNTGAGGDSCTTLTARWEASSVTVDVGGGKSVTVPGVWLNENTTRAATDVAVNGRKVWECYVLGLDPESADATNEFRITSFPLKADGTPDLTKLVFDPPQARWNVSGAVPKVKGKSELSDGLWQDVPPAGNPNFRFFKVTVELP